MYSSKDVMLNLNTIGLLSVVVYNMKKFKDIENNMEELRMEIMSLKNNTMTNNQQSTLLFNKLNKRIDDNIKHLSIKNENRVLKPTFFEEKPVPVSQEDEILEAINELKLN